MKQSFTIHTLHRSKYMLCFFLLLFVVGGLSSFVQAKESVKIIAVLFTIPGILYCSIKISQRPSTWILCEEDLTIQFGNKSYSYPIHSIDHVRSLTRSGGNLYVIYQHKRAPVRYWRNKLFQEDDDHQLLHEALLASQIEYFKF